MDLSFTLNIPAETQTDPVRRDQVYDLLIIGAGPAGLTAAVYSLRKGLRTAIITKNIGGQVVDTKNIQNYMGYTFIEGLDLANRFFEQARQFPVDIDLNTTAVSIANDANLFHTATNTGKTVKSRAIIIAAGKSYRKLNVPGEIELTGKGVAYCATCDAPLFKGKDVAIIGGGNSAAETALELLNIANTVTIFQNLDHLTADETLKRKILSFENLKIIYNSTIARFEGKDALEKIYYRENNTDREMRADGAFIEIGLIPNSSFTSGILPLNAAGEIIVDCACNTTVPGIFAAGDISSVPEKQIIVAAGEGAKAALAAFRYLSSN